MNEPFHLTGTHELEEKPIRLVAGALSVDLSEGNLRTVRHGGIEVLRAVSYIVRDRDWGTYTPAISNLEIAMDEAGFTVSYDAECVGPGGEILRFAARIEGSEDSLFFSATAVPDADFETNRCGFCILHPIVGLAGEAVTVEHVDGSVAQTRLPDLIDPWQPFKSMRAITHQVAPGLLAECRMEGDAFEMEDQRNWSDASYKTYVRPLELPWPYVLPARNPMTQSVTLRFSGSVATAPSRAATDGVLRVGVGESGPRMPEIGIVVYPEDAEATLGRIDALRELSPQALLLHFDPTKGHGAFEMAALAALAAAYPASVTLECAVPCQRALDDELSELASLVDDAGLVLDAIVVSPSVDRRSTPPGSAWPDCPPLEELYDATRRAFPDIRLGGGMLSYFTELNRKRVPWDNLAFVTHCTCPIVHAADDASVMQSLEALPFITRSVGAIYGDRPYRIGPSTIAMRQNPYGSAAKDNPLLSRIPMAARDPRHNALFGAAWAVGYAARTTPAGVEQLVLSGFAGPFGVLAGSGEPSPRGALRPLGHVVNALASMAGMQTRGVEADDSKVAALVAISAVGKTQALIANLTADPIAVDMSAVALRGAEAQLLSSASLAGGGWQARRIVEGRLALPAYAVARLS